MPRLPRRLSVTTALPIADRIAALDTVQNRRHRRNIARIVGGEPNDPLVRRLARRAVRVQTLNYIDVLRSSRMTAADVAAVVDVVGAEHLEAALAGGRGAIIATGHVGSVDWAGLTLTALGYGGSAIVEPIQPPALFEIITNLRQRFGADLVPLGPETLKEAGALLRRNIPLGIAIDWDINGTGLEVPLFGHRMRVPAGPAIVAIRNRTPIVPTTCVRTGLERFRLSFEAPIVPAAGGPLEQRVRQTTEQVVDFLGRQLRAYPGQWVMFHDVWADPIDG